MSISFPFPHISFWTATPTTTEVICIFLVVLVAGLAAFAVLLGTGHSSVFSCHSETNAMSV